MSPTKPIGRGIESFSLTWALVLTAVFSVRAQTATPQPAPDKNEGVSTGQRLSKPADQVMASHQTTTTKKPKKPKSGELIIAPIPISSPAVGSGLVLAVGYVFKLNQEDKLSPPSTLGLAGAFTNSGSRGGLIGGRLYFSEN